MGLFNCSICNEEFISKSKLDNHRRALHQESVVVQFASGTKVIKRNENQSFQCPQCFISFQWSTSIKRHAKSCQSGNTIDVIQNTEEDEVGNSFSFYDI